MGKRRPRYNEKARAASHLSKNAKPHPAPRDGGIKKLSEKHHSTPAIAEQVNASNTSVDNDDPTYSASASTIPDVIIPGEKGPSGPEDGTIAKPLDLGALPEAPTGKLTSKKKKRLEKFIEKQLKKDERVKLLKKLSEQTFSSDLLRSSKAFGKTKLTAKEKLRQALLEERAGISVSNPDIFLIIEKEIDKSNVEKFSIDESRSRSQKEHDDNRPVDKESKGKSNRKAAESSPMDVDEPTTPLAPVIPTPSLVSLAFGKAPAGPAEVEIFDEYGARRKGEELASAGFGSASKTTPPAVGFGSSLKSAGGAFGGALKRKADDGADGKDGAVSGIPIPIPKRIKKKQRKKKKNTSSTVEQQAADISSDSDADDSQSETDSEDSNSEDDKKELWAADVVGGEELAPATRQNTTAKEIPKKPQPQAKPSKAAPAKPAFHVPINRPEAIQVARISLPVVMEEQPIMEAILNHDVTILCGETGSGKTTQVPQFLYEAGFGDPSHPQFPGMVGVTQPRRVAAVSMARRVSEEMALRNGEISYQIRYDKGSTGANTKIKFMTDGILLRELSVAASSESQSSPADAPADLLLTKYSCIIIDEAHERTVGTDVLIGWLTRIATLRNSGKVAGVKPLKLVIMSATLRVEDFTMNETLFPSIARPPVVQVDGRQHKVVIHYNKRTPEVDFATEAFKKVLKIHTQLPPGGILVFLTGQQEIQVLVRKLRQAFPLRKAREAERNRLEDEADAKSKGPSGNGDLFEEADEGAEIEMGSGQDDYEDLGSDEDDDEEEEVDILGGLSGDEDEQESVILRKPGEEAPPLHVLPLYSLLPTAAQLRVFEAPPAGTRLVVVATNVAETSLTIPGIKYVVDCGKVKERRYDTHSGVQTYQVCWTSRASADQRAGRAGRVGPGHCYRLFSSAVFNDYFEQFSKPEILRVPIEGVVLQMKSMGINNVVGFPFPTPPGRDNLKAAEKMLVHLGALDPEASNSKISELGKMMAKFPVSPRYAKMIIVAASQPDNILPYVIPIVAGLSVGDPFVRDEDIIGKVDEEQDEGDEDDADAEKQRRNKKRAAFWKTMAIFSGNPPTSDALRLLTAIGAYTAESFRSSLTSEKFCENHFLRSKAMDEMRKLRAQLTNLVKITLGDNTKVYPTVRDLCVDPRLPPPDARQGAAIRQVLLSGFADRVAKLDDEASRGWGKKKYTPVYRTMWGAKDEVCQIHPSSCLHRERPAPRYVIYEELLGREEKIAADNSGVIDTRMKADNTPADGSAVKKLWLKGVTTVEDTWISLVAPRSLCSMGKVMEQPEPRWEAAQDKVMGFCTPTLGPKLWELPAREVELPRLQERCRWFARFLIEGKVPLMKELKSRTKGKKGKRVKEVKGQQEILPMLAPFLTTKTVTITKSWGKSQSKVGELVDALMAAGVDNRGALLDKWRQNRTFLLSAYLHWVPDDFHTCLRQYWPPALLYGEDDDEDMRDAIRRSELVRSVGEIVNIGSKRRGGNGEGVGNRAGSESDADSDF